VPPHRRQPGRDHLDLRRARHDTTPTVVQYEPTGGPHWNRLLDVPADGGQPRVLFELRYQPGGGNLVYMWGPVCRDPDGEWLLAFATGYVYRIEISSGAVIRLPFPEGQPYDAAW
jgi:hypothetical protein